MDKYLKQYREMISLRGLTDHTIISYSTYIRAYLNYLSEILHKLPEDVSWAELRDFIRWLQKEKHLSDRTVNHCISQLRFFTIYVLHRPWDPTQLPMRRFDAYLPYVPSQKEVWDFIQSFSNLKHKAVLSLMYSSGLRVGEVCALRYEDISRSSMRIHICHSKARSDRYAILSHKALDILTQYWFHAGKPRGFQKIRYYGFLNNRGKSRNLRLIFTLQGHQRFRARYTGMSMAELIKAVWKTDICTCPECGCHRMHSIGRTYGTS